jgi:folylpolyglutamate synthase/dihydropteroate synthase
MIAILQKRVRYWYLTSVDEPRAMPAQAIFDRLLPEERSRACLMATVVEALRTALAQREADEAVLVFGSFPVVGEALEWLDGTAML